MEKTPENLEVVQTWVRGYGAHLPHRFRNQESLEDASRHLVDVYFRACRKMSYAEKVHRAIMQNESWFPLESTIYKWLRGLEFPIDDDVLQETKGN